MSESRYTDENLVHSLVFYEWKNKISMVEVKDLFDEFCTMFRCYPNYVTVSNEKRSFQYKYPGFNKRDVIHKQEWENIGYQWLRLPDNLYNYAAACSYSERQGSRVIFLLDEEFVENAATLLTKWLIRAVEVLEPIYGFMHSKPYSFGPFEYVTGIHVGNDEGTVEGIRRSDFGYVARKKNRGLDQKFRDIYSVNLISQGHLEAKVESKQLWAWINQGNRGRLEQIGDVTWKWSLQPLELIRVRKAMLASGHLIVSV